MKRIVALLIISLMLISLLIFSSCNSNNNEQNIISSTEDYSFIDSLNREVKITKKPKKVISLCSSFADVWQVAGGKLSGTTQDSFDKNIVSKDSNITNLGNMKTPSIEQIISLQPDLVILQSTISEHVAMKDSLESAGLTIAYFKVEHFDDYLNTLKICTDITGNSKSYEDNGVKLKNRIDECIKLASTKKSPTVLFIRAYSRGAKAKNSNYMTGKMLNDLNCLNIADSDNEIMENLSMEAIIRDNPDFIFVTTMGSSPQKAIDLFNENMKSNKAWGELKAVKNGHYYELPQTLFHIKPNAKWADSYEMLTKYLYD